MKTVIIIPARFQSSRFPGKPLADLLGLPMIVHVWQKCVQALDANLVYVATDDDRIRDVCHSHGIQVVMTRSDCLTGTDRVFDASLQVQADLYLNVQGDEPMLDPKDIQVVLDAAKQFPGEIINATSEIDNEIDYLSRTVPKVVARPDGRLLYMSRAPIPGNKAASFVTAHKQVCIYAFPPKALSDFASCQQKTALEEIEDIEILRFLELGYEVRMVPVSQSSVAVDTPQDLERVRVLMQAV
ncbi:3-deoxy-manno-octulosonate cytidylyltransferase [Aquirhabdus sp.]|uniref:3-deoxy-manno-octulosonate cytidylyltransferase n=1 Tax=Aquirhabdus sp. TaxID=2824160 RepID=UPI00396CF70E